VEKLDWIPHPTAKDVKIKKLATRDDGGGADFILVLIPKGKEVSVHVHERDEDVIYPLRGKGKMWIDGIGSFSLKPGIFVEVPKATKHKIVNVTEELLLYDVFCPPLSKV